MVAEDISEDVFGPLSDDGDDQDAASRSIGEIPEESDETARNEVPGYVLNAVFALAIVLFVVYIVYRIRTDPPWRCYYCGAAIEPWVKYYRLTDKDGKKWLYCKRCENRIRNRLSKDAIDELFGE